MYGLIELSAGRPTRRASLVAAAIALCVLAFAASPAMAADGTGTMNVSPTYVIAGSSGNEMTFVYTGGTGGVSNGNITITVPSGWSAPTFTSTSAAGFTSDECGANTDATSGQTIELEGVFVSAGSSCDVIYGNTFEGPGATAPSTLATAANDTFTTKESSTSSGTLTALTNGSPGVTVGADGSGTITVSPGHVVASSTTNKLTFTYTATQTMTAGELTITLPSGWSAPSGTSGTAGFTTTTCPGGTVVGSGQKIEVEGVNLSSTGSCTVVYGAGSGATAQSSGGGAPVTFTTQQEATNDNDLVALPKPPSLIVTAGDGAGTMAVSPTDVIQSSTGNELTFTFTAPPGGLSNGEITLTVPSGWSAPSTTESAAGFFEDEDCAETADQLSGRTIEMEGVYLDGGDTCQLIYGDKFEGPGATAPSSEGATTFTTQEQSYSTGTLTNLAPASQPVVDVGSDGTGTMTLSPTHAVAGSSGNTLTFTYTAGVTMTNGEVTIALPSGWSAPSGTAGTAGYTTTTCAGGSAQGSGQTIEVSGISISSGTQCTITYGNKTGGGPGATATSSGGSPATLTVQEKSSSSGTLTTLGTTAPTLLVTAPDGSGTMTVSPTTAITSSTGNTLTFTYTAPSGGLNNGDIDIAVPSGWSAPSFSSTSAPGFTSDECGANTDATSGQTIELQGVFLDGGDSCQIIYGNKFEGPGATATSTSGPSTFTTSEQSFTPGTLTNLTAGSPVVDVGADGLGTMTATPTTEVAGSTGNTLSFQYTAASNISNGEITIAVPAGWTQPTTTLTAAGAVFSSCAGTLQVSGSTIEFSAFNLASGSGCTITYGYKTDGGSGVTAPASGGPGAPYTFTSQEKSSSSGTLTTLGSGSPSVIVVGADGTGSMAVSPTNALNGSAQEYTFTYTAPSGGVDNGELTIAVPSGWSAPQLSSANAAGYVLDDCGQSTAIASGAIQSSGISLDDGGSCEIIYGAGAAAAVAPSTSGSYTFTSKEKSTVGGTLGGISSPSVDVDEDGVGTLSVAPLAISAGTTGSTLTFTYTSPGAVGLSGGEVKIAIPAGWPAPSTTSSAAGFTSTTCLGATVQASSATIDVTGINLAESSSCTIVYGDSKSGGPGLTIPSSTGAVQFSGQERSSTSGTLAALGSEAQLTVYAADGSGTMTPSPTFTTPGSGGNTLTFTYTAAGGGLANGELTLAVPSGWSAPSTTGGVDGYTSSTCGNVAINGDGTTVDVTSVSLASGDTCKIVYGDTSKGGAGATAPSSAGISSFATEESSTASGTPSGIGSSPQVALLSADGSGTLTVAPTSLESGSSGNTLTFTYTAASGGTQGGEITLAVPTGYPTPSTTGSDPGFTSSDCGTVGVSGATIQITGVTVAGGSTCTIVYGSKASGGPGLTAPSAVGSSTFTAQEASSGSGTLKSIASSPGVTTVTFPVLTVSVSGSGTVTGAGLSCPGTCSKSFAPGTSVTLTATPASGFKLSAWGGACSGNGACTVTVSAAKSVSATFVKNSTPPPPAPKCVVPKLKGDSLAKAKSLLAKAHCSLGKVTKPKLKKHHKAPKLVVGSTSPRAGSKRADHAKVAIKLVAAPKKKK